MKLTYAELFTLFDKRHEEARYIASADSQEYLNVVLYLVERSHTR